MTGAERRALQEEFARAARGFDARTRHRFDDLDIPGFARVRAGWVVVEVGAGTGNFIRHLAGEGRRLVAVDLVPDMLAVARARPEAPACVVADGARLPLRDGGADLVATAQALHHIRRPVPVVAEMARVAGPRGLVLVVDQVTTERYEEIVATNELEVLRDPTHAASRPPSALRMIVRKAGLEMVDERIVEDEQRLSRWMWPGEFPPERIDAVRRFISERGERTGMGFRADGDDYVFVRRRMMLLARRAA